MTASPLQSVPPSPSSCPTSERPPRAARRHLHEQPNKGAAHLAQRKRSAPPGSCAVRARRCCIPLTTLSPCFRPQSPSFLGSDLFCFRADIANVVIGDAAAPAAAAPAAEAPAAAPAGGAALPDCATAVFMPALSSTMTEGKIVQWTKSEGDKISAGE